MDISLFGRVLWRFRLVMVLGIVAAAVLALLSYYSVSFSGGPKLTPRAQQVWQADSTILLTQHGFPAGNVNGANSIGRLIGLGPLYAKLANSDAVQQLMVRHGGPLDGSYQAIPAADTSYGSVSGLPGITVIGKGETPGKALRITRRASTEFINYLEAQQEEADIKPSSRVDVRVLNAPGDLTLVVPRKKTLPIVVFMGVLFATIALVFVLENARRRPEPMPVVRENEGVPVKDLGRSA